jgi:hypothetical protein
MMEIDHSKLPAVGNASLPETYTKAQQALADCQKIDECQSWADKAEALASYAKQAEDESLRKMADRIQARAVRRAGELLQQIEPQQGGDRRSDQREGDLPLVSRKSAADEAGMSDWQRKTALRVANVPRDEFESSIESEHPPTVTQVAEQGKRQRNVVDLKGRDPEDFKRATHFVALLRRYMEGLEKYDDIEGIVSILDDAEREKLRKIIPAIDAMHDKIITRL